MMLRLRSIFFSLFAATLVVVPRVAYALETFTGDQDVQSVTKLSSTTLSDIVVGLMKGLLYIVGFLAIIAFVIAAIWYLTSAGDEGRAETGKKAMVSAVIGVIVALIGLIVVNVVSRVLGGETRL